MLFQRGFPFDSSGMCVPVEKHLYTKGINKWICISECLYTKQNMKLKIIFRFKIAHLSARRTGHFLFLLLRFPHGPALTMFFGSFFFVIKETEWQFHLPVCVTWVKQYIGFEFFRTDMFKMFHSLQTASCFHAVCCLGGNSEPGYGQLCSLSFFPWADQLVS